MGKPADVPLGETEVPPLRMAEAVAGWVQEVAPYGIFITDDAFVVRSWNQWLATHSGLTAEAVIGRSLWDLFPSLRERRLDERYARALDGEISILSTALHQYLLPFPPPTREYPVPHMLQSARIAPLARGERGGTITVVEDVTQRECQAHVLSRQQEYDRLLSHAAGLLLKSESPNDVMTDVFPRLAGPLKLDVFFQYVRRGDGDDLHLVACSGLSPELRRAFAVLSAESPPTVTRSIAAAREPVIIARLHERTGPACRLGQQIGLRSYAGFPLVVGDTVLGTLSFGSYEREELAPDEVEFLSRISLHVALGLDRAQREEKLRAARGDLERRVVERTARLNDTIEQLESFSYTVAHDLRAPIRSLIGFSDILMADYGAAIPPDGRELLGRLHRASVRLDALTRDLLFFSRLGGQHISVAIVDLDEVIRDIRSVSPALQESLAVERDLGKVWAQRTLLQQCLSNLFDNALKFADPGRGARIVLRTETVGADRRIWVEDNGIGIHPGVHGKIFEIFERIPGERPVEGTGIGLAIVARATKRMGGTYGVESTPGAGSRFWVQFPDAG